MKKVRFTTSHYGYNAGEVAGFEDAEADKLVAQGVAKVASEEEVEASVTGPATEPAAAPAKRSRKKKK